MSSSSAPELLVSPRGFQKPSHAAARAGPEPIELRAQLPRDVELDSADCRAVSGRRLGRRGKCAGRCTLLDSALKESR